MYKRRGESEGKILREELAAVPGFDLDTTHFAVEVAEDVVQVCAVGVAGDGGVRAREVLGCPDGRAAAVA
jgi:hypothetical protein